MKELVYISQLVFWLSMLAVLIVLLIQNIRADKESKKRMAELDKKFKEKWTELDNKSEKKAIKIKPTISNQLDQYRVVKAQTEANGERYFVEALYTGSDEWTTLKYKVYDTYESALGAKLFFEQTQLNAMANQIKSKEVIK